jgi:histidinol-phosphatase
MANAPFARQLTIALAAADAARRSIQAFGSALPAELKPDGSDLTAADTATEQAIRAVFAAACPADAVVGEEMGDELSQLKEGCGWIVDPIDGTTWYALGVPLYASLIAYVVDEEPVVGVIELPASNERVYASRGQGCFYQRGTAAPVRVNVRSAANIASSNVSASGVHATAWRPERFATLFDLAPLARAAQRFRLCGDAMQYHLLCRGMLQVALDTAMKPWDLAAHVVCVEEAGGVVADLNGVRAGILRADHFIAAADANLRDQALALLATHPA